MTALIYDFNKIVNANSLFLLHRQHPGSHPISHVSSQYWIISLLTLRKFLFIHLWRLHSRPEVMLRSVPFSYVLLSYLHPWDPKNNQANSLNQQLISCLIFPKYPHAFHRMWRTREWSIRRETEINIDVVFRNGLLSSCVLPFLEILEILFKRVWFPLKGRPQKVFSTGHFIRQLLMP